MGSTQRQHQHYERQRQEDHGPISPLHGSPMKDHLVQVWPVYDPQLNAFLLEMGFEGQRKQPSFQAIFPIHGQEGSAWIKKSHAAGLDVRTGYHGYGDGSGHLQTHRNAQVQQIDNTFQHNLPAPVQNRKTILGPTINTTDQGIPKLNHSHSWVQMREQALKKLENQTHQHPQSETIKLFKSSSFFHKVPQTGCSQDFGYLEKAVLTSPSLPSCETPRLSSSSKIQSSRGETTRMDEEVGGTPNTQSFIQNRSQDTPDQEEVDLLHINKRSCGSMGQSYRTLAPPPLQLESRSDISKGATLSKYDSEINIDHVAMPGHYQPTLGYQSSTSARVQGQPSANDLQSWQSSGESHRSPLDYVRAPGAYTSTSGYRSPYPPLNDTQATPTHQETATAAKDMSAAPNSTYRFSDGTSHPTGRTNWTGHGPSYSSFKSLGHADIGSNMPWNARVSKEGVDVNKPAESYRQLPEPISPGRESRKSYLASNANMSSERTAGSKEGNHSVPGLTTPERAVLDHIAPWNSSHSPEKATQPGPGLRVSSENTSHAAFLSFNSKNGGPLDASSQTANNQQGQTDLHLERLRSLPRPQTYFEYTGGMLPNRHPRETGICSNMDFKSRTFIDAHGATFTGNPSGPYRYKKPENRAQELAIIQATYQTINDFELYIGSSPRQKQQTWESYEFQYRQLQHELIERWLGPPELIPKLR